MSIAVIKAEHLGKKFIIGHQQTEKYTALRDVITNNVKSAWAKTTGLVKGTNRRDENYTEEEFWAINDVSFQINQGDRVGILGRNGAGKSTLLKLLSRITEPTTGRINIRGRIASLLEVGTGFHPELTGRENIFLNGAILGMSRAEIRNKFDEIVAFSEVEKFLDTPVKRYSSGMYVRLAFAIAAHLEPDILIVDEVLAVGDAQFQKKCIGKMEDVSKNEGRTVLFVSHNMGVVAQLCKTALLLRKGQLVYDGDVSNVIEEYIRQNNSSEVSYVADEESSQKDIYIKSVELKNRTGEICDNFLVDENIIIRLKVGINKFDPNVKLSITLQNMLGDYLSTFVESLEEGVGDETELVIKLPANVIAPNTYAFRFAAFIPNGHVFDLVEMACPMRVVDSGSKMALYDGANYGSFIMNYEIL